MKPDYTESVDSEDEGHHDDEGPQDGEPIPDGELEEDMYGMTICSLIRDVYHISDKNKANANIHKFRLAAVLVVMGVCLFLQVFLIINCQKFVSAKAVHDIRDGYDVYELAMYTSTTETVNGKHRGVGAMNQTNFHTKMTADAQATACRIPLSQPDFFFAVLFIWTLTTCREIKQSWLLFNQIVGKMPTCESMAQIRSPKNEYNAEVLEDEGDFVVHRLPWSIKIVVSIVVLIPRVIIACYLLWLGCRWLLATDNFADLILNAVALEFILCLKDMLFASLMSAKNRQDVQTTKFPPTPKKEHAGSALLVTTAVWLCIAFGWVVIYIGYLPVAHVRFTGLQAVLPGYKWDVHEVCEEWVAWRYCVAGKSCPSAPGAMGGQDAARRLLLI